MLRNLLLLVCIIALQQQAILAEHCARFAEREDGEINYDPDNEVSLKLGSIATLQCHNGNIRRSRCTANGWKPSTFNRCQTVVRDEPYNNANSVHEQSRVVGCPAITNITNGFVGYSPLGLAPYMQDTTASLVCNLGYVPSGSISAKCQSNGLWTDLGSCEPSTVQQCTPLADIPEGQISYSAGPHGPFGLDSVAELSCRLGYTAVGNNRVSCGRSGWEPAPGLGTCVEGSNNEDRSKRQLGLGGIGGQCPLLAPVNGQINYLQANPSLPQSSGTSATLVCNPNFTPVGSTSSYCSGSIWSPAMGTCQPMNGGGIGGLPGSNPGFPGGGTCAAFPAPINGQINYSLGGNNLGPFPNGATASLVCTPGYLANVGVTTASCQNGQWVPSTLGQCTPNTGGQGGPYGGAGGCPPAAVPANSQLQYSGGQGIGNFAEGASVNLICNAGFTVNGPATSFCRGGQWYPPVGQCNANGLGQPPQIGGGIDGQGQCLIGVLTPANGRVSYSSLNNPLGPYQTGTSATLTCNPGFIASGAITSYCQNGGWNPPLGACNPSGSGVYPGQNPLSPYPGVGAGGLPPRLRRHT